MLPLLRPELLFPLPSVQSPAASFGYCEGQAGLTAVESDLAWLAVHPTRFQLAQPNSVKIGAGITCSCHGIDTRMLYGYLGTDTTGQDSRAASSYRQLVLMAVAER